ncbi:MAG: hypothetical protein GY796_24970 [Chloroflexi bacterium]|nr:hypothetical protein [Chloroflexota bacterium]
MPTATSLAFPVAGDDDGAAEDFTVYVEWTKAQDIYSESIEKREKWIETLEMAENPFDEEMLEELLQY